MKIAYLSTFYPFRGGIAQFNALLYKAFERKGQEVKAFTFTCQYPSFLFPGKSQYVTDKDRAIPIDSTAMLNTINPFSYESTAKEILKWQPDVLVMKYWMSFFAPAFGHIANRLRKKGIKIIVIVDNALPHEPRFFDKPFSRLFFNQVDGFVVMSEAVKKDLLSLKPDAKFLFKSHPLYNHFGDKIPLEKSRTQLGMDEKKRILLFFGLIRDYKGLDLLIDALSFVDDSYQLIIAGESYGSFEKYQQQIDKSSAKDRIKIINRYIDDDDVPVLFSAADILVLPYKSATQSGVIPVAYHFEVPTVATDVGGLRETLEIPGTGVICLPDPKNIAEGIEKIYSTGKETFTTNIQKEKKNLTWEEFAKELISFAESL